LSREIEQGHEHIFSHELAKLLHITPVQVRRDIMLIGHSGSLRKGYNILDLIDMIGEIIDCSNQQKVAIIGIGKLGQALLNYLADNKTNLVVSAVFDNNQEIIGTSFSGVLCHGIEHLKKIVEREHITIGILTVPPQHAVEISKQMVEAGILGIINYTPVSLQLRGAYLEQYDVITSLEKVAYFAKPKNYSMLLEMECEK
jgi:redox-sensing transcriptional repressor